ncbi:hypothetical protein [Nocardia alba]|uniref:MaoC dehydratase-like protein n=1 Tax=Nocardia alba TaxID=225051 RepID=A0A4V2PB37_9NOCA|nr:hypothetical protein [Nocardia alba]TCJ95575.1 hypothetical protein DFR71_4490 [Nocardia alba]
MGNVAVVLDTDAIRLFAQAARSDNPAYRIADRPVVPPTFLPADGSPAGEWAETDHRFFGPPPRAGDRLTAIRADSPDRPGVADSLTRYFDRTGGLVAESWAAAETFAGERVSPQAAALLATYATDWLGAETIRRFRTRSVRPLPPGDVMSCSGRVTQSYLQDGESRVDVSLCGADATGAVVVRAWATFAVTGDATPDSR